MKVNPDIGRLFVSEENKNSTFWKMLYNRYSSNPYINIFIHNSRTTGRKLYQKYEKINFYLHMEQPL